MMARSGISMKKPFQTMVFFVGLLFYTVNCNLISDVRAVLFNDLMDCVTVPKICPNNNITYWLYTRATQNAPHQLDISRPETIENAPFSHDKPFKILIHGYTGWKDYSPNTEIRPALFQHADYNVISLDYAPLVKEPCYLNAVQNAKVVANCTAQMIDYLVESAGIPLKKFHVIGFSLGAQVSGLIYEFLKSGQLDHVTGLDPALPLFWVDDVHEKLDRGDAKFVDVIHTNAGVKGKIETCGHVDFYCNGGSDQPGCDEPDVENADSCNHARAPAYYAESIISKIGFWGKSSGSSKDETSEKEIMGFHVPRRARGVYFLNTNAASPFARGNVTEPESDKQYSNILNFLTKRFMGFIKNQ